MDRKVLVNYADFLSFEEADYIKEMSITRTGIPMMGINLEERFPDRCFDRKLLHNLKKKHVNIKFGVDGHNVQYLFKKGELIRRLGGKFVISPSQSDLGVDSIHFQTKLQGEYTEIYSIYGFLMADGTFKMTQYDFVFVFWMIIDGLLRSKFVGYSILFTENTSGIIEGAQFFHLNMVLLKISWQLLSEPLYLPKIP